MAGLTFGSEKDSIRLVVDNGVGATDTRVMRRTNEATQELLAEIIPVGGMMEAFFQIIDTSGTITLPKTMENIIEIYVVDNPPYSAGTVYGSTDVRQGFYDIVNPFTYIDPAVAHDNPLIDKGLVPDPDEPEMLVRQYLYPGGPAVGTIVHVIGAKRYQPITQDSDYLIIQNVPALKTMIQAIERRENLDIDGGGKLKAAALEMLQAEVRKHLSDPRNFMRRKANYELDLINFKEGTMGWIRARMALELPGALMLGKEELGRLLERAETRCMEMGIFKGCIEEFSAPVVAGHVVMPGRVESVLAADLCGQPLPVRSIFFKYLENGPGDAGCCSCIPMLEDEGDILMNDGRRRHKYRLSGAAELATAATTTTDDTAGGGSASSADTITAGSYLYIGSRARLVATNDGMRLEVKDGNGDWLIENTWSES